MSRGISLSKTIARPAVITKGGIVKSAADEAAVQGHDFSQAGQLSPLWQEALWSVYRRFAEKAGAAATRMAKEPFSFEVASIETKIYADISALLPDPFLAAEIFLSPMPNPGLILMPLDTAFSLIELRAGGSPRNIQSSRNPSDMELVLLESVMIDLLIVLKASWAELCELSPRLAGLEPDYRVIRSVKPFETVVLAAINVRVGKASFRMYLCLPLFNLKSLWADAKASDRTKGFHAEPYNFGSKNLDLTKYALDTPFELSVVLCETSMSFEAAARVEAGNIVLTEQEALQPAALQIESPRREIGRGEAVRKEGQFGIRLTETFLPEPIPCTGELRGGELSAIQCRLVLGFVTLPLRDIFSLAEGLTLLLDAAPSGSAWLDIGGQYRLPAEILVIEGKFAARLLAPSPIGDKREEGDSAIQAEQNKRIDALTQSVEELRSQVGELSRTREGDNRTAFLGPEQGSPERTPAEQIESVLEDPDASARVLTMLVRSGRQIDAALALIAMGYVKAAELLKRLDSEEIDTLTFEIARMDVPEPTELSRALGLVDANVRGGSLCTLSGVEYARTLLETAVGTQEAAAVINRLTEAITVRPFDFIRRSEPSQVFHTIKDEHPQIIALILSFLDSEKAALLFSWLEQDLQVEVIRRIASMKPVSPMVLREIERVIEARLAADSDTDDQCAIEGVGAAIEILNLSDQETELRIIEALEKADPETAQAIKDGMFVFEDIVLLDDPSLRRVIAEVDTKTLAAALAPVQQSVRESFFRNMPDSEVSLLKEELGNLDQIPKDDALSAQHAVVAALRSLEETGQIRVR